MRCITWVRGQRGHSFPLIAQQFQKRCWKASCSVTAAVPSQAQPAILRAASQKHTAAPCSSTKSEKCRHRDRPSCCAYSKIARLPRSVPAAGVRLISASSLRPTRNWRIWSIAAHSGRTYTTGSMWCGSNCHRCATGRRIFYRFWIISSASKTDVVSSMSGAPIRNFLHGCAVMIGPVMCASCAIWWKRCLSIRQAAGRSGSRIAGLSASGAIQVDLGGAGPLVAAWWRARHEQMTAEERNAFFARLFGTSSGPVSAETGRNTRFEDRMFELAEALVKLEEEGGMNPSGGIRAQSRVRSAARNLSHNLSDHSGGATAFIASEVMKTLKDAFAVLSHPAMRSAFHARDLWGVVRGIARAGGQLQLPDAQPYVRRGKAGMILISWLADRLEAISGNAPLVELADPVIAAAVDWLEATLALADGATPAPSPATQNGQPASVWSALAD